VLFGFHDNALIALVGFIKKTQATPKSDWRGSVSGVGSMNSDDNPHTGSSFESWLEENDLLEDATSFAIKEILAMQIAEEMKKGPDQEPHGRDHAYQPFASRSAAGSEQQQRNAGNVDEGRESGWQGTQA
jgi:hypothetical protein